MAIAEDEWMGKVEGPYNEPEIDEAMLAFGEFVAEMTDVDGYLYDSEEAAAMQVEEVELSMPVQLDLVVSDRGDVVVGSSPPLYYAETTFLPVFHQLKVRISATKNNTKSNGISGK